jgi:signal transduction histidine kinase
VEPCDDGIRICVDDAGPGVPVDRREHVFTRFASAGTGGVGLGLAIVARHVREHGGSVWVGDRPGGGSRFVVELPMQAP